MTILDIPQKPVKLIWHSAMITDQKALNISEILCEMQFIARDLELAGDFEFPLRSIMEKRYTTLLSEVNSRHKSN